MDKRLRLTKVQKQDFEKLRKALEKLAKDKVGLIINEGGWLNAINMTKVERLTTWDDPHTKPNTEESSDDLPAVNLDGFFLDYGEDWYKVIYKAA